MKPGGHGGVVDTSMPLNGVNVKNRAYGYWAEFRMRALLIGEKGENITWVRNAEAWQRAYVGNSWRKALGASCMEQQKGAERVHGKLMWSKICQYLLYSPLVHNDAKVESGDKNDKKCLFPSAHKH